MKISLRPKYKKIQQELVQAHTTLRSKDSATKAFIELNANMVAEGLQLLEDMSDTKED